MKYIYGYFNVFFQMLFNVWFIAELSGREEALLLLVSHTMISFLNGLNFGMVPSAIRYFKLYSPTRALRSYFKKYNRFVGLLHLLITVVFCLTYKVQIAFGFTAILLVLVLSYVRSKYYYFQSIYYALNLVERYQKIQFISVLIGYIFIYSTVHHFQDSFLLPLFLMPSVITTLTVWILSPRVNEIESIENIDWANITKKSINTGLGNFGGLLTKNYFVLILPLFFVTFDASDVLTVKLLDLGVLGTNVFTSLTVPWLIETYKADKVLYNKTFLKLSVLIILLLLSVSGIVFIYLRFYESLRVPEFFSILIYYTILSVFVRVMGLYALYKQIMDEVIDQKVVGVLLVVYTLSTFFSLQLGLDVSMVMLLVSVVLLAIILNHGTHSLFNSGKIRK